MTKNQERTFSMCKNVQKCLQTNSSSTANLPQYAAHYALFETTIGQIAVVQGQQLANTTKVQTQSKAELRRLATHNVERLLIAINAYALITQNNALKQSVAAPLTEYRQSADTVFAAQCNNLYDIGFAIAADLTDYGIDANLFTDFRANIDDYTNIITNPRQTAISNAATTALLATLFSKIKKELADLTILIQLKKFSEPNFYHSFVESCRIIDNNTKKNALRVSAAAQDSTPLRNVIFTFIRQADNKVFEYKTNENGIILRPNFKAGLYSVTIAKIGYTPFTASIDIQENITYKLNAIINTTDKTISC
jgi:hypothetical protein